MPIRHPRVQIHEIDHSRIEQDHSVNRNNYQIPPWYEYIQTFNTSETLIDEINNFLQRDISQSVDNGVQVGIDYGIQTQTNNRPPMFIEPIQGDYLENSNTGYIRDSLNTYHELMNGHNTQVDDYMKDIMTDLISHKIIKDYSMNYKKIIQEFCKRNNLFLCDKNTLIRDLDLKDRLRTFKLINHEYCCFIPYTNNGYSIAYKKDNHFQLNNIPMTYSDVNEENTYFCMYTFLIQIEKLYRVKYINDAGAWNSSYYVLLCDCKKELKEII